MWSRPSGGVNGHHHISFRRKRQWQSRTTSPGPANPSHAAPDTAAAKNTLTLDQLSQFTGDLVRYRHGLNCHVIYTPGVQFLAERAGAYWLIDVIASYRTLPFIEKASRADERIAELHFWRLDVAPNTSAVVTARAHTGCEPFVSQQIPFTDFPLEFVSVWAAFDGEHWVLYLPSEH